MKSSDIIFNNQEIIEEGLKFGQAEKRIVDKEGNNIRIGIEYEYHLDEDKMEEAEHPINGTDGAVTEENLNDNDEFREEVDTLYTEKMDEELRGKEEEFIEGYVDQEHDEYDHYQDYFDNAQSAVTDHLNDTVEERWGDVESTMNDFYDRITDIIENFESNQATIKTIGDYTVMVDTLEFLGSYIEDMNNCYTELESSDFELISDEFPYGDKILSELNDLFDSDKDYLDKDNFGDFTTENIDAVLEILKNTKPLTDDDKEKIEDLFGEWDMYKSELEQAIASSNSLFVEFSDAGVDISGIIDETAPDSAEDLWESEKQHFLGFDPDDFNDDLYEEARAEIYNEWDREGRITDDEDVGGKIESIEAILDEDGVENIEEVETETVSGEEGIETKSNPITLKMTKDMMKEMFEHIKKVGHTSTGTGMHINISHKYLKFNKDHFNPLKLIMLTDPKWIHKDLNFPTRGHVANMFNVLNDVNTLINLSLSRGFDELEKVVLGEIKPQQKSFTLNFKSFDEDVSTQRIELRFFGGENYEHRYDEIVHNLYRVLYYMLASYSPTFGEKEYKKKLIKTLNSICEIEFDMTFPDLVALMRRENVKNENQGREVLEKRSSDVVKSRNRQKRIERLSPTRPF